MSDIGYFISDLHLGSAEEPNAFVLLKFLRSFQSRQQISHLFLLGDIFDLWVAGHDYFKQKFAPIIVELVRLRDLGVQIHYFEGNHDLYLEHYFGGELRFEVHRGPEFFYFAGKQIRIEHGDQMDPSDRGYRFLRWLLRTPILEWLAPRLPSGLVLKLGEKMSRVSRRYTSQMKTISTDRAREVIRSHAARALARRSFEMIISGHVHVVDDSVVSLTSSASSTASKSARAINLGSWLDGQRALLVTDSEISFRELN